MQSRWKDPPYSLVGGLTYAQGLMLGRVKIFWERADVWLLLFKATTKEKKSL